MTLPRRSFASRPRKALNAKKPMKPMSVITYRQLMRAKVLHLLKAEKPFARWQRMRRERMGRR